MQRVHECWRLIGDCRRVVSQISLTGLLAIGAGAALLAPMQAGAAVCEVNDVDICLNAGPYNATVVVNVAVPTGVELPSTDLIDTAGIGVNKTGVGSMTFFNYGSIDADNPIKINSGETTIENSGDITAVFAGIFVDTTDTVNIVNNAGATVSSTISVGLALLQAGSKIIYNAGTISGAATSITSANGGLALTLDTGSVLNGNVSAIGAGDSLTLNGSGTEDDDLFWFNSLTMDGGQWTLSGTVAMDPASPVNINNGTLLIDGTMTDADVTVAAGAAFGGTGAVSGDVDTSGQIDATSDDFTIDGNLTFQTGSSLAVSLGGGTSTKVDVTGNAIINSGSNVVLTGDLTQDTAVTILTTGGLVSGSFDKVFDENGKQLFFVATSEPSEVGLMKIATVGVGEVVLQAATGAALDAHRGMLGTIHARIDHRYRDSAHRRTPRNSLTGYYSLDGDTLMTGSLMNSRLDNSQVGLSQSGLWPTNLDDTVQSDPHTPGFISDMLVSEQDSTERMSRSLGAMPRLQVSSNYGGMWIEGFAVKSDQDTLTDVTGYSATSTGVSIGLDSKAAGRWVFGGMIGYGHSDVDLRQGAGEARSDTVYTGVYMSNISRTHFANLFVTGAIGNFDAERAVTDGITSGVATDEFGSYMWDARLELGRTLSLSEDDFIRPNIAIEYTSVFQDDYADDGAGIVPGLTVQDHTTELFRAEGQIDVLFGSMDIDDSGWSGRFFAGAAHEILLDNQTTNAFLAGFSDPLSLATSGDDHRTFALYGVSLSWAINQRMRYQLSYHGEGNEEFNRQSVVGGFSISW